MNSQVLFDNKIKEVAKSNFDRFSAFSANIANIQLTKTSYTSTGSFRKSKSPTKSFKPKSNEPYEPRNQSQSSASNVGKDFPTRMTNNS